MKNTKYCRTPEPPLVIGADIAPNADLLEKVSRMRHLSPRYLP